MGEEKSCVESAIRKWFRKSSDNQLQTLANENLVISIRVHENLNEIEPDDSDLICEYIGNIDCVICKVRVTVWKLKYMHRSKGRWVLSNFYRHLLTHTLKDKMKKTSTPSN